MSTLVSDFAAGTISAPYAYMAGAVVGKRFYIQVPSNIAANDILDIAPLPFGSRILDVIVDADELDSGAALTFDVGFLTGEPGDDQTPRTCGDEFGSGLDIGQSGGVHRPAELSAFRTNKHAVSKSVGVKITNAPATGQTGQIGITLLYAAD